MKRYTILLLAIIFITGGIVGCGPSEEEQRKAEQARQDSLEEVRQQHLEERQDSIARADSIKAAKKAQEAEEEEERMDVAFDEDGNFAVQVEAWRSRRKAEEQIKKWQNRGFENAFVVQHGNEETGDIWFRVRLGRLSTQEAARNLQAQIKENYGANSWVSTAQ
ncbi:SPOR domain-containing protein [Aliifodinibius salicampi]|uniref:SPOR domain-containing protein n=1 Tax=Fodinibius salicampi TaxID=1920655 RepID=A0ABT3PYW7_9BACT|nr:SPOR domain-containing protein [Fodinibius salicampi]MCW9713030.1 SPOR domain-containing protein [Fodinibius salicampi]